MDEQETIRFNDERFWCENCCNFDKEHVCMDGTATCKLTDHITWCQSSGQNCVGFNVPPRLMQAFPVLPGDRVMLYENGLRLYKVDSVHFYHDATSQITMTRVHKKVTMTLSLGRFRELARYVNNERVGENCEDCVHRGVCEEHAENNEMAFDVDEGGPNCRHFRNENKKSAGK